MGRRFYSWLTGTLSTGTVELEGRVDRGNCDIHFVIYFFCHSFGSKYSKSNQTLFDVACKEVVYLTDKMSL